MPFGTRRRPRQSLFFSDPILPVRLEQNKKIKEISKQGLENTSQREEARPSAKAPIQLTISQDKGEGVNRKTPIDNKLLKSNPQDESPMVQFSNPNPTGSSKIIKAPVSISKPQSKPQPKQVSKPQSSEQAKVLQIITDKVKINLKKAESKIKALSAKGMRGEIEKQIKLKEVQLSKLRTLLSKCPTCN